ncbi:MAG: hypothetical protein AAGN46_08145 [Acidobacteriota bacterium]
MSEKERPSALGTSGEVRLSELQVSDEQREIVHFLGRFIAERLPLEENAVRGFFWRSLRRWQNTQHRPSAEIGSLPTDDRLAAADEIFEQFTERARAVLRDERAEEIDRVAREAREAYADRFVRR